MSPLSFIKRPALWVDVIDRFRATHVQSPNFGLKLTARKWAEDARPAAAPRPDLSSLRHIFNAAEPVTLVAMRDFVQVFAPLGLRPEVGGGAVNVARQRSCPPAWLRMQALHPGYGLAEHTVYVSDGGRTVLRLDTQEYESNGRVVVNESVPLVEAVRNADAPALRPGVTELVSCGPVTTEGGQDGAAAAASEKKNADIVVVIVDPETSRPVPADTVGEVWIRSPSKARGYWGKAELTAAAFGATLVASPPTEAAPEGTDAAPAPPTFLRTGDRGFLHAGELYISGRIKDLLIVRGRNHYPQVRAGGAGEHARCCP